MDLYKLSKAELIEMVQALLASNDALIKKVEELTQKVEGLEQEIFELKSKKNSGNSSLPPSQDPHRAIKNKSLRKTGGRKRGGQPGHKGHALEMTQTPDEIIEHMPHYCQECGEGLCHVPSLMTERRQVVDLPPIHAIYTEHRAYAKACRCGKIARGAFPPHVKAPVQYGPGVTSLAGYLSVRQYLPYQRMRECFRDIFGISISEGGLVSAVRRLAQKSLPVYHRIKENIEKATVVGADETGAKVNGAKAWFWVWQNPINTFIAVDKSRGFKAIEHLFPNGLPGSILISDCLAAQLKTPAQAHQLCLAHLQRDLNFFIQLYDDPWAKMLNKLFCEALRMKDGLSCYGKENPLRDGLVGQLEKLLGHQINELPPKVQPFLKRLRKNKESLFLFLFHEKVPPDNNASERAIRNIKVKQKISGQFVCEENAVDFAVLRSVMDTVLKNGQNVFNALKLIAKLTPE